MNDDDKKEQNIESFLDVTESVVDLLTGNDLLASIPIVSTAANLLRVRDSIQDKLITKKLCAFLNELDKVPVHKTLEFKEKLRQSPEESHEIGELLIELIDKVLGDKKPRLIGLLFIAFLDKNINTVDFKRIAQAIDIAFWDDLVSLIDVSNEKETWKEFLANSGLTNFRSGGLIGDGGKPRYFVSELGNKLRAAITHARQQQKI